MRHTASSVSFVYRHQQPMICFRSVRGCGKNFPQNLYMCTLDSRCKKSTIVAARQWVAEFWIFPRIQKWMGHCSSGYSALLPRQVLRQAWVTHPWPVPCRPVLVAVGAGSMTRQWPASIDPTATRSRWVLHRPSPPISEPQLLTRLQLSTSRPSAHWLFALCRCSQVQAMRLAHLVDGGCAELAYPIHLFDPTASTKSKRDHPTLLCTALCPCSNV